jgi:type II secretory pathway pseudopilin PulG
VKKDRAFLLFEVLIAILIASTALIVLMQGLGGALRGGTIAENYLKASMLAKSRLSLLFKESAVKPGADSGKFSQEEDPEQIFSWEQKITAIESSAQNAFADLSECEVILKVAWKTKSGERDVSLVTYVHKYEESQPEK